MDNASQEHALYNAIASVVVQDTVPHCPPQIKDKFITVATFWKNSDSSSDDDMRGLVTGLLSALISLSNHGLLDTLDDNDLSMSFLAAMDDAFAKDQGNCMAEMDAWYPTLSTVVEQAETSVFYQYALLGLYCVHTAVKNKYADTYIFKLMEDAAAPLLIRPTIKDSSRQEASPETRPATDPVLTLLHRLSVVSQTPGVSFTIMTDKQQSYVSVRCPNGLTVAELKTICNVFEDKGQIFCENNVISILIPIF